MNFFHFFYCVYIITKIKNLEKIHVVSFLLYVHKVQVIPDLTRNDPDAQNKMKTKKRTEPISYQIKIKCLWTVKS